MLRAPQVSPRQLYNTFFASFLTAFEMKATEVESGMKTARENEDGWTNRDRLVSSNPFGSQNIQVHSEATEKLG